MIRSIISCVYPRRPFAFSAPTRRVGNRKRRNPRYGSASLWRNSGTFVEKLGRRPAEHHDVPSCVLSATTDRSWACSGELGLEVVGDCPGDRVGGLLTPVVGEEELFVLRIGHEAKLDHGRGYLRRLENSEPRL